MKAALLNGPSDVTITDRVTPECGDGQVLVKISHVGICGTDTKIYDGGIPANYPVVMGHEGVGEIIEGQAADGRLLTRCSIVVTASTVKEVTLIFVRTAACWAGKLMAFMPRITSPRPAMCSALATTSI